MRLIDADALLNAFATSKHIKETTSGLDIMEMLSIKEIIDNAPELGYEDGVLSVENATRRAIELEEAYNNGWSDGFNEGENERPQSKWIKKGTKYYHTYMCASCLVDACRDVENGDYILTNYCPNCGARMKGGAE